MVCPSDRSGSHVPVLVDHPRDGGDRHPCAGSDFLHGGHSPRFPVQKGVSVWFALQIGAGATYPFWLITRETVAIDTPARAATSFMVGIVLDSRCRKVCPYGLPFRSEREPRTRFG